MAIFRYKAATATGELEQGVMPADDQARAVAKLQAQGLIPISVEPDVGGGKILASLFSRRARVGQDQIAVFTAELATLLRAGLPLDRAFSVMIEISEEGPARDLLGRLQDQVRGGASLADAMAAQGSVFSKFYISMIRAGEAGGALEVILTRVSEFLERAKELRETVTSALIYPAILLSVAGISVIVLLTFVVPQFQQLFQDAGKALPLATQIVISVGDFLQHFWWAVLLGLLLLLLLFRQQLSNPVSRYRWDGWFLRWPLVGDLVAKLETARLSRTLATLLINGVPLLSALEIVKETMTNRVLAEAIGGVADSLREGNRMADPLMETGVFPKMAIQMVKVGEESGQLEQMLNQVADAYDAEVRSAIKRSLAMLEPALILGLAVIIAGIILSILVAILSINELAF